MVPPCAASSSAVMSPSAKRKVSTPVTESVPSPVLLISVMVKIIVLSSTSVITTYIVILISLPMPFFGGTSIVIDMIINGICLLLTIPIHKKIYHKYCWYYSKFLFKIAQTLIHHNINIDASTFTDDKTEISILSQS